LFCYNGEKLILRGKEEIQLEKRFLLMFCMLLFILIAGCGQKEQAEGSSAKVELTVSAAASLQDVLKEITTNFEKEHPNINLTYNYGASGALQQQIIQGAPVDLFFSAAEDKFDQLAEQGLIESGKGADLVRNELVLIVPKDDSIKGFEELTKMERISIGTPETVPAGKYAKETLENQNLWNEVKSKVVYAKDVRQVLTYVETGNVDAGLVYKTDAMTSDKVKAAVTAHDNTHSPIVYPAGIIKETNHPKEAELFFDYLQEEEVMKIFEKYGFKKVD
jgi:molybdate transport system substrate-binding protein